MKRKIIVLKGDHGVAEIERIISREGDFEAVSVKDGIENACAETVLQKADAVLFAGSAEDVVSAKRILDSFGASPAVFVLAESDEELERLNSFDRSVCVPLSGRTDAAGLARFIIANLKIRTASVIESERKALRAYVTNLLMNGSINTSHNGFGLLRDAIVYCVEVRNSSAALGKEVYREIAKANRMTPVTVERNIRTTIERGWKTNPEKFCAGFFGSPCTTMRQKPTAKEFISTVAERVALELG